MPIFSSRLRGSLLTNVYGTRFLRDPGNTAGSKRQSKPLPAYILVEQGKGYIAKQALRDKVSYLVHDLV
jgi:hypothetical protein